MQKKKSHMLSYESKFLRHEKHGQRCRIFHECFLNGKVRFWSVYVFFIKKKRGVKNKGTILSTNQFDLR